MLYFAMFDYIEKTPEVAPENGPSENPAFFTAVVEAPNPDAAAERFRSLIIRMHDETDLLLDAGEIYLSSVSAIPSAPSTAAPLNWVSIRPFGKCFSSMSMAFNDATEEFCCRQHSTNPTESEEGEDEPFIDLSKREIKRPLYRSLARKKQRGTLESFRSLSDGDLYALFVLEGCTDREVAELFDIKRSQVSSKRRRAGATLEERALVQTLCNLKLL